MASVASVAVELYEFLFSCFLFPLWIMGNSASELQLLLYVWS